MHLWKRSIQAILLKYISLLPEPPDRNLPLSFRTLSPSTRVGSTDGCLRKRG